MDSNWYLNLIPFKQAQKIRYMEYLQSIIDPAMGLQGVLGSFGYSFDIDNAAGAQLDTLGEIVGVSRTLPFPVSVEGDPAEDAVKKYICANTGYGTIWGTYYDRYTGEYVTYGHYGPNITLDDYAIQVNDIIAVEMQTGFTLPNYPDKTCLNLYTANGDTFTVRSAIAGIPYNLESGQTYYFKCTSLDTHSRPDSFEMIERDVEEIENSRRHMEDDEYRLMIKLKIAKNVWDGTNVDAERIYRDIIGEDVYFRHCDNQNGTITLYVNGDISERQLEIMEAVDCLLVPAGIGKTVYMEDNGAIVEFHTAASVIGIEIKESPVNIALFTVGG